jgi:hypothetical protein
VKPIALVIQGPEAGSHLEIRWPSSFAAPPEKVEYDDSDGAVVSVFSGAPHDRLPLTIRAVWDPGRSWAMGTATPRWRQRTIGGRRWSFRREGATRVVLCSRLRSWVVWITAPVQSEGDAFDIASGVTDSLDAPGHLER